MRDEKKLLDRAEDEAAVAAAQKDLDALERGMLDGGSREKLALAQAILAAQDIAYEPVRAVGLLEELVRTPGDPESAREAAGTLGGRYDGAEPVHPAEYSALLDDVARSEKKYRKQTPGRLTLLRVGLSALLCAALALGSWLLLPDVLDRVRFPHLLALGVAAGLIVLAAARRPAVAGLTAAAVTGCLAAVRYNGQIVAQAPRAAAVLFGALAAFFLIQLALTVRRSRQTGRQAQAREHCLAAYDAAIAYAAAGISVVQELAEGRPDAALRAYLIHWEEEGKRLRRARRRIERREATARPA